MTGKTTTRQAQINQRANALNNNRGTSGANPTNAMVQGNRGKQLNPNQVSISRQPEATVVGKIKHG